MAVAMWYMFWGISLLGIAGVVSRIIDLIIW